jgi:hypothetical protein
VLDEPFEEAAFPPDPARTVTAEAFAALAVVEILLALEVPFPPFDPSAWTVIALPTAVVVVAPARPAGVRVAESTFLALDEDICAAAWAPGGDLPPADTVIAACVPFALPDEPSRRTVEADAAAALGSSAADFCRFC